MASEQLQEANQIDQFKCPMTRIFHSTMHPRYSCHHPHSFLAEQCKSGTACCDARHCCQSGHDPICGDASASLIGIHYYMLIIIMHTTTLLRADTSKCRHSHAYHIIYVLAAAAAAAAAAHRDFIHGAPEIKAIALQSM